MSGDAAGAIWGGFVADAASLGFHWLYDPKRIAELAGDAPAFRAPDPADFDGAMGVFVHPGKRAGDLSQYGVQMRVMLDSLRAVGGWDKGDFQTRFAQTFGAGGSWSGYIDKATKGTLAGIAEEREPSGAADDQLPAIAKLPPLMWALRWNDGWAAAAMEAVEVTSNHDTVRAWAPAAIAALRAAFEGAKIDDALAAGVAAVGGEAKDALASAIGRAGEDPVAFTAEVGPACPLPQALPSAFQVLARSNDYRSAVEDTIRAGGDNCGRAVFVGAMAGAVWSRDAIPLGWSLAMQDGARLWAEVEALAA